MKRNVLIAAGGTGGHISPGVALAEELFENKEKYNIGEIYIHSLERNKDNPDLNESVVPVIWHNTPQINIKILFYLFPFLFQILKTFRILFSKKIHAVIAMGGYSCIPSLLYALVFRKEIFLCEQNRVMGKITRLFLKRSKRVAFSFPPLDIEKYKTVDFQVLGNPLRKKILPDLDYLKVKASQLKQKQKFNVLVLGGSQGARQINNMVIGAVASFGVSKKFHFRILTGKNLFEEAKKKSSEEIDLISYSQDMKTHYQWADLVIARAGAGVIYECLAFALPMILIPYPFAADNHQFENAKYLEEKGAAILLNTQEENPELISNILLNLDTNKLLKMSKNSSKLAELHSTQKTLEYFFGNANK